MKELYNYKKWIRNKIKTTLLWSSGRRLTAATRHLTPAANHTFETYCVRFFLFFLKQNPISGKQNAPVNMG